MLLSAVSVLVVPQSSSEIPEGLMNNPVLWFPCQYHSTSAPYSLINRRLYMLSALAVHYAVHWYLKTEIMSVLLFGQSKTSVIDIIDDGDDNYY